MHFVNNFEVCIADQILFFCHLYKVILTCCLCVRNQLKEFVPDDILSLCGKRIKDRQRSKVSTNLYTFICTAHFSHDLGLAQCMIYVRSVG